MDKREIADEMIKRNNGAVPIFLDLDRTRIEFNMCDINGLLICGKDSSEKINDLKKQLSGEWIQSLNSIDDLDDLYNEFCEKYKKNGYEQKLFVVIEKLDEFALYDDAHKEKLIEMLRKGYSINMFFICGTNGRSIEAPIDVNFLIKIDDFYSHDDRCCSTPEQFFNCIGNIQSLKIKK